MEGNKSNDKNKIIEFKEIKRNVIRYHIELGLFFNSFYIIDRIQQNKLIPFSKQFIQNSLNISLISLFSTVIILYALLQFPNIFLRKKDKWINYKGASFKFFLSISVISIMLNNFFYMSDIIPKDITKMLILIFWFNILIYVYRYIIFKLIKL